MFIMKNIKSKFDSFNEEPREKQYIDKTYESFFSKEVKEEIIEKIDENIENNDEENNDTDK